MHTTPVSGPQGSAGGRRGVSNGAEGAIVGSAVGDALGAPYEFGPAGALSARFPPGREPDLVAGGGWDAGEATDDTQLAVHVADSLLERGGLDPADVFARFRAWLDAGPKDAGLQTEAVLTSGLPWDRAAADHAERNGRAAGNGSLMRVATSAVYFAAAGRAATMDAARTLSALTHGDPAAGEGCAILHELIRVALDGGDPLTALPGVLAEVHPAHRGRYAVVLADGWTPDRATEPNGAVWPALGSAVWALRTTASFPAALRAAVDLGGDTDTVAAITGALAGAVYGAAAIPAAWTWPLFVPVPGRAGAPLRHAGLVRLAARLVAAGAVQGPEGRP